jgi:hypothetical protein
MEVVSVICDSYVGPTKQKATAVYFPQSSQGRGKLHRPLSDDQLRPGFKTRTFGVSDAMPQNSHCFVSSVILGDIRYSDQSAGWTIA